MSDAKATEFSPLSITILKLLCYSDYFDIAEIAFYEWLIVKAKAFKGKQFYYSYRRITEEVRIKRVRLDTIIRRFAELGIIRVEIKGMPKQHHFTVDFEYIIALIPQIYQFTETSKLYAEKDELYAYFHKLYAQTSKVKEYNKEFNKEPTEEELRLEKKLNMVGVGTPTCASSFFSDDNNYFPDSNDEPIDPKKQKVLEAAERKAQREAEAQAKSKAQEIERLKALLNRIYAERVKMHNGGIKKGERVKTVTMLSFLKRNEEALFELGQEYGKEEIENSFIAYVDQVLSGHIEVGKLVPYFLSRKPQTKDFDTFHTYLNYFIAHYSRVK